MWRTSSVPLALLLSDAMWLYALVSLGAVFRANPNSPLGLAGVMVLLGIAFVVAQSLDKGGMSLRQIRLAQVAAWVMITYLVMAVQLASDPPRPDVAWPLHLGSGPEEVTGVGFYKALSLGAAVVVWWRGLHLAVLPSVVDGLEQSFRRGAIIVTVAAVVHAMVGTGVPMVPVAFLFFGVSLLGLAVARIQESSLEIGAARSWWYRLMGGTVAAVLLVGAGLAALSGGAVGSAVLGFLGALGSVVRLLLIIVVAPFVLVVYSAFSFVWDLLLRLFGGPHELPELLPGFEAPEEELVQESEGRALIPEVWFDIALWLLLALGIAVALWLLARAFRRRERPQESVEVERESLWEGVSTAGEDLRALLVSLIPIWRPRVYRAPPASPDWGGEPRAVVYGLYQWISYRAAVAGVARRPYETPLEFQQRLLQVYPAESVATLTGLFNRVRYGGYLVTPEEVVHLRGLWQPVLTPTGS